MNATKPIVHVVDDDESFRVATVRLLDAAGYEACGYTSASEFLLKRPKGAGGCVVLDIQLPGLDGLQLQEAIMKEEPLPIVFLSGHGSIPATVRAMKAGAVDFLTKPVDRHALLDAVKAALAKDIEWRSAREKLRVLQQHYQSLTLRERQVFDGVVAGKLNKEIAGELGTVERTVKAHRAKLMKKMQAASLADLVHQANSLRGPSPSTALRPQA